MYGRVVLYDEDCGDCLCRFCARNSYTDNYNLDVSYADCEPCEHCYIGETLLIESELDCPDFAPDEEIFIHAKD